MPVACAEHADRAASFHCEGCGRVLCEACVEQSHRLWICRHCRERALPIGGGEDATPASRARAARLERPASIAGALAYVFRGGGMTLAGYVVFLTAADLLPGLGRLLPPLLVAILLPGFLLEIVRRSAEGDDTMPDWPDPTDFAARASDWLKSITVVAVSLLPYFALRRFAGCDVESFLITDPEACAGARGAGILLAFALALFGFGAVGTWESGWLALRLDLHLEALLSGTRGQALLVLPPIAALLGASLLIARAVGGVPLVGSAIVHSAGGYALFTTAHLAGVLFRVHRERLERIYLS
jgi:hypothetical protein